MTEAQIISKINKAKRATIDHLERGEYDEANTKSALIERLEDLLIAQQREEAVEA